MQQKINNSKGFTLVEVMIVTAILGVLASIALPNFVTARRKAQEMTCISNMRTMNGVLNLARTDGAIDDSWLWGSRFAVSLGYYGRNRRNSVVPEYISELPQCPYNPCERNWNYFAWNSLVWTERGDFPPSGVGCWRGDGGLYADPNPDHNVMHIWRSD